MDEDTTDTFTETAELEGGSSLPSFISFETSDWSLSIEPTSIFDIDSY
jgi:hypothetical protein